MKESIKEPMARDPLCNSGSPSDRHFTRGPASIPASILLWRIRAASNADIGSSGTKPIVILIGFVEGLRGAGLMLRVLASRVGITRSINELASKPEERRYLTSVKEQLLTSKSRG